MKRILPLILALVAGMAQADSNSDYRAGSDFAHQIKGQGSSSIQGFKPQESIPGYNANPDETKYGTVAKLAMRQPFVLFKGLTFQKLCL
ncbi:hypothetical protein ACNIUM_26430, partial [Escherichia coli]